MRNVFLPVIFAIQFPKEAFLGLDKNQHRSPFSLERMVLSRDKASWVLSLPRLERNACVTGVKEKTNPLARHFFVVVERRGCFPSGQFVVS